MLEVSCLTAIIGFFVRLHSLFAFLTGQITTISPAQLFCLGNTEPLARFHHHSILCFRHNAEFVTRKRSCAQAQVAAIDGSHPIATVRSTLPQQTYIISHYQIMAGRCCAVCTRYLCPVALCGCLALMLFCAVYLSSAALASGELGPRKVLSVSCYRTL
jgi:hypothetical protein